MASEKNGEQSQPENGKAETRSNKADARSERYDDWRSCEPPPYCGPPPYWDPYCGPPPYHGRHYHHWRHHFWPPPGSEFFESMLRFAASTAGSRGRWWREMADAARYARRDYARHDPYFDPYPPPWSYSDPCAPYPSYCDPHERRGDWKAEAPDPINIKDLRATLEKDKEDKLKDKRKALQDAESSQGHNSELANKLRKELTHEAAKADAVIDAVIHDVKLARVAEAMRRKQWSRGSPHGRGY
jgi:hypothetical protein